MLNLAYDPSVPRAMLDVLEHHARRLGLALDALERIGQSLDLVEEFIVACEGGRGPAFVDLVGLREEPTPTLPVALARLQAAKLLG